MVEPSITNHISFEQDRAPLMVADIKIEPWVDSNEIETTSLIKRNMESFDESEAVLIATFRRLNNLKKIYSKNGCCLYVARNIDENGNGKAIACAGLGPLHGLPLSEGIGEIRDLVVDKEFRGQGIGSRLLHRCIEEAKNMNYQRLYLETSQNMNNARKLFLRSGFRAVTESTAIGSMNKDLPCYFLMENLNEPSKP